MVPRETGSFVSHQDSRENKTSFPIYLDFSLNNHIAKTNKQRQRAGNNCATTHTLSVLYIILQVFIIIIIYIDLMRKRCQLINVDVDVDATVSQSGYISI